VGLLDSLFNQSTYGGQGGGLLDMLRQSQMQQEQYQPSAGFPGQASPMAVGGYQMPRIGDQAQFTPPPQDPAALPPNAQPAQGQLPMQPQQPQQSQGFGGFLQGLNENFQNMGNGGSLIGALTGQRPNNQTAQYLVSKGIDPAMATTIVSDPSLLRSVLPSLIGTASQKSPTSLGDGYIWNPTTKKVERAYTPQSKEDKVGEEIKAREDALKARGIDPKDPKQQQYVLTGKYPREDAQPLSAADKKAIMAAEDDNAVLVGTIDTLSRAKELNSKTFTGATAGARGWIGTAVPGASAVIDPEAAKATREFGQLMSGEAIKSMAETLKGATTDREMGRFLEMLADPSTPPDIRERTINRMLQLAERQRKINDSRVADMRGGTYYKPGHGNPVAASESAPPSAAPSVQEGATATNPQTGQKLTFRNGKWQ
jgi:hypothetical protein